MTDCGCSGHRWSKSRHTVWPTGVVQGTDEVRADTQCDPLWLSRESIEMPWLWWRHVIWKKKMVTLRYALRADEWNCLCIGQGPVAVGALQDNVSLSSTYRHMAEGASYIEGNTGGTEGVGVEEREILVLDILNLKCKWEIQQKM